MNLGVTGSRNGITDAQRGWLSTRVGFADVLHHGACIGADEDSHYTALELGVFIVVHPPIKDKYLMYLGYDIPDDHPGVLWRAAKEYLARDRDIVDETERLIALPDGPERRGSGTWYTINYARNAGKDVDICFPSGKLLKY